MDKPVADWHIRDYVPQFTHDCSDCEFLGRWHSESRAWGGNDYDLYVCGTGTEATLLARYGNDGPEYSSGTVFALICLLQGETDYPLIEALRRLHNDQRVKIYIEKKHSWGDEEEKDVQSNS